MMVPVKFFLLNLLANPVFSGKSDNDLNVDKLEFDVTGPGLKPDKITMPARYFFIAQKRDENQGDSRLSEKDFRIEIKGRTYQERECRYSMNILNRKDGSFIVRYKMYETCRDIEISIFFKSRHIAASPYKIKGTTFSEDCYCPERNIDRWLENYGCGAVPKQIISDLNNYTKVDFNIFYKYAISKFNNSRSSSVCHYIVKNNDIFRTCYGEHVGFKIFMDNILLSLTRKVRLPDLELFSNLGDWPLMKRESKNTFPMFSWCGSEDTLDIVMPTYEITESSLECMGRVSLDMLSVQGNIGKKWNEKYPKAFWRGRDSSRERLKLIEIARNYPDIFNASLTNFFFFRDEEDKYGPKEPHISFFKFFDYKYQINLDGTVAAYRLPYLLTGDAVVFKQDSKYYEFFYKDLTPWEHYVPFKSDLSNLVQVIKWAIENDEKALEISRAGRTYARNNLLPQHIFCYYAHLLNEWSKRLINKVKVKRDMEKVEQKTNIDCDCPVLSVEKDEL